MKFDPTSRRMFLQGAGGALLSIPLLGSLLPKAARAQSRDVTPQRFIMVTTDKSPNEGTFFGQFKGRSAGLALTRADGNVLLPSVGYRSLSEVNGDLSYVLAPLTPYKKKMTLLRSLDVVALEGGPHPISLAGTCAGHGPTATYNNAAQASISSIIASKIYSQPVPASRRQLVLSPYYSLYYSTRTEQWLPNRGITATYDFNPAWSGVNEWERAISVAAVSDTQLLMQRFIFSGPSTPQRGFDRRGMLNRVYESYRRVSTDARLSRDDQRKLEAYMALVGDLETEAATPAVACTAPSLEVEPTYTPISSATDEQLAQLRAIEDCRVRNHVRIVAAAMLCDLTRVASFALYSGSHAYHHASSMFAANETSSADAAHFFGYQRRNAQFVANLMSELDKHSEGTGTLLDHTLIYWGHQYGTVYTSGGGHSSLNMPVVLAGGVGGKLRMGYFVDYRVLEGPDAKTYRPKGVPLNNLAVTLLNCFGLSSKEYEFKPGAGYGNYEGPNGLALPDSSKSTAGRRSPLPFVYTGSALG